MKYAGLSLFLVVSIFTFSSCREKITIPPKVDRTVLIYMAADNSLDSYVAPDLDGMKLGMKGKEGNLLVYIDRAGVGGSQLVKINSDQTKTVIAIYPEENSASTEVLSRVVNEVFTTYPAVSTGLVLWSHGMGWRVYSKARAHSSNSFMQRDPNSPYLTKYFGEDQNPKSFLNNAEIAAALSQDRKLDFILFDACFMASVEAVYDLRNSAKYIIGSSAEILASGFPYSMSIAQMFAPQLVLEDICRGFVDHYRKTSMPSACISLINTAELEPLAATVKTIFERHSPQVADVFQLQGLENNFPHQFFDLGHYMEHLTGKDDTYDAFQQQLDKVVIFKDSTPRIFSAFGTYGFFELKHHSGLNTFVMQSAPQLKTEYLQNSWAQVVGLH